MKKIFFVAVIVIVLASAAFLIDKKAIDVPSETPNNAVIDDGYKNAVVTIADKSFKTLVSDTPELRTKGLSGRQKLKDDEAMLFVFDAPEQAGFWMKDMLFSIDIVWVGEDFRIVTIEKNVSPLTFPKTFFPKAKAKYVIEFLSGTIDKVGAKEGDSVSISY